ncbi:family 43 glycosylhydrolase [Streptomyces sp. KMM 9044]|nr:family 43 glycosylhydrolase [Streptomyces sp. KMM 9044]WAX76817.1 family 43 glycosylhydrolase [Streptomyces sp. KMM 9044]
MWAAIRQPIARKHVRHHGPRRSTASTDAAVRSLKGARGACGSQPPRSSRNPVLPGSHPDPSVPRVGDDLCPATSTFDWHPGVRLRRSRDLVNWQPLAGALNATRLLDLTGCPDSGGVWAPNLTYADGLFHLVYSNVSTCAGGLHRQPRLPHHGPVDPRLLVRSRAVARAGLRRVPLP